MIPTKTRKLKSNRLNGHFKPPEALRLDIGCGPNPKAGFEGCDQYPFDGKVKHVIDLREPWPFADGSVTEIHSSHFVEHLTAIERCHFWNELYRVLKPNRKEDGKNVDGFATVIVPHWASCRAYGDPTHVWPPFSEFAVYYLMKDWRMANAPHTDSTVWSLGYNCNLEWVYGCSWHPAIQTRNPEYQQHAREWFKEAMQDLYITLWRKD